ncbi:MAG TPA: hypothetical protein VGC76_16070 [Pyrinomonadaceae bacterium]|jgi:hypothetical protein
MTNNALDKLKAPAIGLIVTAALDGVIGVLCTASGLLRLAGATNEIPQVFRSDAQKAGYYFSTGLLYGLGVLSLVVAPIVIFGAVKMLKGQKSGLVRAAAILSFVPVSCCFPLGAVFGIWALVVLSKPEVKAVFQGGAPGQSDFPQQGF